MFCPMRQILASSCICSTRAISPRAFSNAIGILSALTLYVTSTFYEISFIKYTWTGEMNQCLFCIHHDTAKPCFFSLLMRKSFEELFDASSIHFIHRRKYWKVFVITTSSPKTQLIQQWLK